MAKTVKATTEQETATTEQETAVAGYYVAAGKSITTLAGVKGPLARVVESDVSGGEKTLAELVQKGYLEHVE